MIGLGTYLSLTRSTPRRVLRPAAEDGMGCKSEFEVSGFKFKAGERRRGESCAGRVPAREVPSPDAALGDGTEWRGRHSEHGLSRRAPARVLPVAKRSNYFALIIRGLGLFG